MRQVAGLRDRPPDRLIAVLEQRVEIVDERLHFGGIPSVQASLAAVADSGQPPAQPLERRQTAAHVQHAAENADEDEGAEHDAAVKQRGRVQHDRVARLPQHDRGRQQDRAAEEPHRPENRTEQDARAQRAAHHSASTR